MYKKPEISKYYYPKKINWSPDENQFVEKLFFKMHYPCASSVTIDKKGNYILNLGEFGKREIWSDVKELSL